MNFNRNEHSCFVQRLDKIAEKNPILWLPCVVLIFIAIGAERVSEWGKSAFSHTAQVSAKDSFAYSKKPFALRVVAMSLSLAFAFTFVPNLNNIVGIDAYAYVTYLDFMLDEYTEWYDIVMYTGFDDTVYIPSAVNGKPVQAISGYDSYSGYVGSFQGTSVQKVILPNSIYGIYDSSFKNCRNLESINIPNIWALGKTGRSSIGYEAFKNCSSLSSISIPACIQQLGDGVFENCTQLTSAVFPNEADMYCNAYYIGSRCFAGCTSLEDINLPILKADNSECIGIMNNVFENCISLDEITIPDGYKYINEEAFLNCSNLIKITIPQSVTEISESAFNGCNNLTIYGYSNSYAETFANANNMPFKDIKEFSKPNPPSNIISSESGKLIYEAMFVDGYRPVTQYSIDAITIKFGNGAVYDDNSLFLTVDNNMLEINKCYYTDSCVTVYYTVWGIGKTNITITANDGENITIPISIYDSSLKLKVDAEIKDVGDLKVSGKNEIKNDPFQVGFSITPHLERNIPSIDIDDRELFAEINTLYEKIESKVKTLLKIEKIAISLPNGFIFEDGSIVDNAIPIIPFRLDEMTTYFSDKKVLTKVAPITDTGSWKETYIFNVYIKMNGNEYNCDGKIYVENADYISPPSEDNPTISDEHRDYYLKNDEYSKKLYNSIRAMISEGNFVETYTDKTLGNCVVDSNTYHDMITMLGIWKTAATSEFTIVSDFGSYRNSVNNYCLEFYNISVKDPNNIRKSAKKATVRFQLVDDLANYSALFQIVQQDSKDIKFDATFNHIIYQIEWSDKSYGINGIYNGIYQVSAGADINSYYDEVKEYLSTKYDNEIKNLLKNCFYGFVGNPASPLNFMSEVVEFCRFYEQANKKIGSIKKLIRTNVSFGMVCGAFKDYKVFCPVDVYVYDYDTEILLGSIVNNEVNTGNRIKMYVEGETKCFELPTIKKYKVKLVGNDTGNMTYSINEYDKGQVYKQTTNFYNLSLQAGKEYTYILDKGNDEYLTEQNGNVIHPSDINDNAHIHSFNTGWSFDSISHWHECSCGERADTDRHTDNGGIVTVQPTSSTTGTKVHSCTVCGCVIYTETIPALGIIDRPDNPDLPPDVLPMPIFPSDRNNILNKEIELSVRSELTGLSSEGAHIESIRKFFSESATIRLTETADSQRAAELAMNNFDNEKMICYPFDISVYSTATGEKIQLRHSGYITFEIPAPESMVNISDSIAVYHIAGGTPEHIESEIITDTKGNKKIKFTAKKFSPYMFTAETVEDITAEAAANSVSSDLMSPVSNGVTVPAIKLPRTVKWIGKKKKYRVIRKRRIKDLIFVF